MRIIIVGLPGAGKGTQAEVIKNHFNIPHISTGNIFKSAIANETPLGKEVKDILARGELVSDTLTSGLVEEVLRGEEACDGFLLDGYPRNLTQARHLEEMLQKQNLNIDAVVYINVDESKLMERLTGRRVCPKDGMTYHLIFNPPKVEGQCDVCGTALVQRSDDQEAVILDRLTIAKEQTMPILEHYKKAGIVLEVDGNSKDISSVSKAVLEQLEQCKR